MKLNKEDLLLYAVTDRMWLNGRTLKEVVKETSIDRIVLETDCPYLSPVPNRGKRNSSLNLPYVVDMIAELKGITAKEVMEKTWENAKALYRMTE